MTTIVNAQDVHMRVLRSLAPRDLARSCNKVLKVEFEELRLLLGDTKSAFNKLKEVEKAVAQLQQDKAGRRRATSLKKLTADTSSVGIRLQAGVEALGRGVVARESSRCGEVKLLLGKREPEDEETEVKRRRRSSKDGSDSSSTLLEAAQQCMNIVSCKTVSKADLDSATKDAKELVEKLGKCSDDDRDADAALSVLEPALLHITKRFAKRKLVNLELVQLVDAISEACKTSRLRERLQETEMLMRRLTSKLSGKCTTEVCIGDQHGTGKHQSQVKQESATTPNVSKPDQTNHAQVNPSEATPIPSKKSSLKSKFSAVEPAVKIAEALTSSTPGDQEAQLFKLIKAVERSFSQIPKKHIRACCSRLMPIMPLIVKWTQQQPIDGKRFKRYRQFIESVHRFSERIPDASSKLGFVRRVGPLAARMQIGNGVAASKRLKQHKKTKKSSKKK